MSKKLTDDKISWVLSLDASQTQQEIHKLVSVNKELTASNSSIKRSMLDLEAQGKKNSDQYEVLSKSLKENNSKISENNALIKAHEQTMKLDDLTMGQLTKRAKELGNELNRTSKNLHPEEYAKLEQKLKDTKNRMNELKPAMDSIPFGSAGAGMAKFIGVAGAGIATFTSLYSKVAQFKEERDALEQSKASLESITGLNKSDIGWLTKEAEKLSTTTTEAGVRITASSKQIVDGFTTIGSKRPELLKNKEALAEVTKQALILAAAGVEPGMAFDVVTASLNQFDLAAGQSSRVINVLAAGSLAGSAEANDLAGSLKNCGTVTKDSNLSFEQTVATLEVLASKQLLGEEAGTKLRGALLKLKEAGVGYASGQFNMRDALIEVNKKLAAHSSAVDQDAIKQKVFGAENITAGTILLQNVKQYDELTKAVTGSNEATRQAIINTDTNSAKQAQAKNRVSELGQKLVGSLTPALIAATNSEADFLEALTKAPEWIKQNWVLLASLTVALGTYTGIVAGATIVDKAKKVATDALNSSTVKFFKTLLTNPYIAIGVAIAAVTIAVYKLVTAQSAATKAYKEYQEQSAVEITRSNQLFESLKKTKKGTDERRITIAKINEIYGTYLGYQLSEKANLDEIEKAQQKVNTALREKIALQIKEDAQTAIAKKYVKDQLAIADNLHDLIAKNWTKKGDTVASLITTQVENILNQNMNNLDKGVKIAENYLKTQFTKGELSGNGIAILGSAKAYANSLKAMNAELKSVDDKFKGILGNKTTPTPTPKPPTPPTPPKGTSTETDKERKARLAREKKERADALKLIKEDTQLQIDIATKAYNDQLKAAGIYGVELNKLTADQVTERIKIEEAYYDRLTTIATDAENKRYAAEKKGAGIKVKQTTDSEGNNVDVAPEASGLKGNKLKAYEILYKQHQINLYKITVEDTKKRTDFSVNVEKSISEQIQEVHAKTQEAIATTAEAEQLYAKQRYEQALASGADMETAQEQYNKDIQASDSRALEKRLADNRAYAAQLQNQTGITEEERQKLLNATNEAINKDEQKALDDKIKNEEDYQNKKKAAQDKYVQKSIADEYNLEMKALDKAHADGLLSEEEYQKAKLALKLKAAQQYVGEAQKVLSAGSDLTQALSDAETKTVDANYQKQLSSLNKKYKDGIISETEYNTEKKNLDNEAAQKKLDIQKKYADANFALQVAQIAAAAALGIMNAWASSMTIPEPGGTIAAVALTALITATSVAQIAAANAERQRVKSLTLDADTSSSSTVTGTIVNSTTGAGYAEGGYTGDGGKYEVAGYASDGQPYHKGEYFVAQDELRRPDVVAHVRAIETVRQQRTSSNPLPAGYANGGFSGVSTSASGMDTVVARFEAAVEKLQATELKSSVNYYEFETAKNTVDTTRTFAKRT